jgi:acyl-CoA synthetase (AMP-forming)/AMP-acid ligase II
MSDPQTMDALIRLRAAREPAKPMVVDSGTHLCYGELDAGTRRVAAGLIQAGLGKGSRVGLIMPNSCEWVRIALALTRIGAVLVPLSTLLTGRELAAQLRTAAVTHLIAVDEFSGHRYETDLPRNRVPALRAIWTPERAVRLPRDRVEDDLVDALAATVTPSETLVTIFTSGSSGAPKGVIHSHGNAFGAVRAGLAARCISADSRLYLPMPFFWVGGFGAGILSALLAGATLITEAVPEPTQTLRLLERERVTLFRGWPDQAEALARHVRAAVVELSTLRPGSLEALLPPELRGPPGARAKLFGMTETFGPYCGYPADTDMPESAWGSCGKPFPGMEIRIVDTDTGAPVPAGIVGMIQVRGPHIMRGVCRRSREEVFTVDGFYPTGDLGHLDAAGFLFYHGRFDDMFKVSGATVYPGEVEDTLRTIAGVDGVLVTNVLGPQGNAVGAMVVCGNPAITVEDLRAAARKLLSSFKVPTVWVLVPTPDAIPRGATGKVDVARLRALLSGAGT